MEQIIIISLLIIIILILIDRKFTNHYPKKKIINTRSKLPSIMGETKRQKRIPLPTDAGQGHNKSIIPQANSFDPETTEEVLENTTSKKQLDDLLVKDSDWDDEEEDWRYQDDPKIESGFATGVTFQELSAAGQMLQQDMLELALESEAVDIIRKIEGTELFDLLENSVGDASKRIASLLSQSISNEDQVNSLERKDDAKGFDIGEFI